jgi:hypothetical protein
VLRLSKKARHQMFKLFSGPGTTVAIENAVNRFCILKNLSVHRACGWVKSEAE